MYQHTFTETPDHLALQVSGNLDTVASAEFEVAVEARMPALSKDLVVNLSSLVYLNSTGIRAFLKIEKLVRANGRKLTFVGASDRIIRIFSYCGLEDYFDFAHEPEHSA